MTVVNVINNKIIIITIIVIIIIIIITSFESSIFVLCPLGMVRENHSSKKMATMFVLKSHKVKRVCKITLLNGTLLIHYCNYVYSNWYEVILQMLILSKSSQ